MEHPIAAIATPNAPGGIGIIRISGEGAFDIADKIFRPVSAKKVCNMKGYTAAFGKVFDQSGDIDEAVCLVFRAPKSYTGEDVAELSCHGGINVLQRTLRAAISAGARPAEAGEFTKRAWLNGRMTLNEAEAVMDIIGAQGEQAAKAALNALEGNLSREMDSACSVLLAAAAQLSAWVDYPDDDIEELSPDVLCTTLNEVENMLSSLLARFDAGKAVTAGVNAAIVGRPNTGKSTLMNLLAGCEKSIVTDIAGTTRDVVEETVRLGDALLKLSDTAGIHETDDAVESIGVGRAVRQLERAQLIFAVLDGSLELSTDDIQLLERCKGTPSIAVINKSDLGQKLNVSEVEPYVSAVVEISAKHGDGIEALEKAVGALLGTDSFDPNVAMLATERQHSCALSALNSTREAINALNCGVTLDAVNACIDSAIDSLLELTGKKACQAVVDEVFSRFCVGK